MKEWRSPLGSASEKPVEETKLNEDVLNEIDNRYEEATREFEEESWKADLYQEAARVSKELKDYYEENGKYVAAVADAGGVEVLAIGGEDSNTLTVNSLYDPDELGEASPFSEIHETEVVEDFKSPGLEYETTHLGPIKGLQEEWGINEEELEARNERIVLAPGLEEPYREKADNFRS